MNQEHQGTNGQGGEHDAELDAVRTAVARLTAGHTVLELGCGHGDASKTIVHGATCVVATDPADLPADVGGFDAVLLGFVWSRLKREAHERYLKQLRARLGKDVLVVMLDDCYVEGSSLPVARTDLQGNTYQMETAPGGGQVEMPKCYPTDSTLRKRLSDAVREIKIQRWERYWVLSCRLK